MENTQEVTEWSISEHLKIRYSTLKKKGKLGEIKKFLWFEQSKRCAICKNEIKLKESRLDHSHKDDRIRGVLCNPCNIAIGIFKDNKESLINAIKYITIKEEYYTFVVL